MRDSLDPAAVRPSDHVDIDVGDDLREGNRRMLGKVGRSIQSLLFTGNQQEEQ